MSERDYTAEELQAEAEPIVNALNDLMAGKSMTVARTVLIAIGGMYLHLLPEDMRLIGMVEASTNMRKAAKFLDGKHPPVDTH